MSTGMTNEMRRIQRERNKAQARKRITQGLDHQKPNDGAEDFVRSVAQTKAGKARHDTALVAFRRMGARGSI